LDQGARISQQYIGTNLATRFFSMFWAGKMYMQKELKWELLSVKDAKAASELLALEHV